MTLRSTVRMILGFSFMLFVYINLLCGPVVTIGVGAAFLKMLFPH